MQLPSRHPVLLAALTALALPAVRPAAACAQASVNADVTTANAYVWRGLTFTNRPVVQPHAHVTLPAGRGSVVAGAAPVRPTRLSLRMLGPS